MGTKSELVEYGFEEVGEWEEYNRVQSSINFQIFKFGDERVVYAFVVNDEVKYVGICEKQTTSLKDRMSRYKDEQGNGTNSRIAGEIRECLARNESIKIHALNLEERYKIKDLEIDLVRGLENPLIEKFDPPWNKS